MTIQIRIVNTEQPETERVAMVYDSANKLRHGISLSPGRETTVVLHAGNFMLVADRSIEQIEDPIFSSDKQSGEPHPDQPPPDYVNAMSEKDAEIARLQALLDEAMLNAGGPVMTDDIRKTLDDIEHTGQAPTALPVDVRLADPQTEATKLEQGKVPDLDGPETAQGLDATTGPAGIEQEKRPEPFMNKTVPGDGSEDGKRSEKAAAMETKPADPVTPTPEPGTAKPIDEMTKAELLEWAENTGIDVKPSMTKAEIIDTIKAHG